MLLSFPASQISTRSLKTAEAQVKLKSWSKIHCLKPNMLPKVEIKVAQSHKSRI